MEEKQKLEHGVQPIDAVMQEHAFSNNDLVKSSKEPITHKMVNKARRGRRLSRKVQRKIEAALNAAVSDKLGDEAHPYAFSDLFTYNGG